MIADARGHAFALGQGHEQQRDRSDWEGRAGGARLDLLAVNERPIAFVRHAKAVAEAIVDPAGVRFAARSHGDEDAERGGTAGEVAGTVERIDDPAIAAKATEHRRISESGFLA